MNNQSQPAPAVPPRKGKVVSKPILWLLAIFGGILFLAIAIPNFVVEERAPSQPACIHVLMRIVGAKEQWALDNKKTATDTPTWADLIGTNKYLKVAPACPRNGVLTIGAVNEKPKCSVEDHSLP